VSNPELNDRRRLGGVGRDFGACILSGTSFITDRFYHIGLLTGLTDHHHIRASSLCEIVFKIHP
jgi:hypothetical protein